MTDILEFTPYIVATTFREGPLCATAIIAHDPTMAAAAAIAQILRATATEAELAGIVVVPLTAEFLAAALNAARGQKPSGTVVSLVPPERAATEKSEPEGGWAIKPGELGPLGPPPPVVA